MSRCAVLPLLCLVAITTQAWAQSFVFPADAGVVDVVRDYRAAGDGVTDDTAAIRTALAEKEGMIYFPNGTYLISDTLDWAGSINKVFQGQSRDGVIIRLKDTCPGFNDPLKPRAMIRTGFPPAIRFRNALRNLTIDCGNGNPGAIALRFYVNNQGHVTDVTIRSGANGSAPGAIGLALDQDMVGPLLIRNVSVLGFAIGIKVLGSVNSVTMEDVSLQGQREVALLNDRNLVFARKLQIRGEVPAIVNDGMTATLCLVDSRIEGTGAAAQVNAVSNHGDRSAAYVRNLTVTGYTSAIFDRVSGESMPAGTVAEWSSRPAAMLFPSEATSLGLPVVETPEVPWDADHTRWANVCAFGANPADREPDGEAIQKALDSGASTVYFPQRTTIRDGRIQRARYIFDRTITIPASVSRLIGLESTFMTATDMPADQPLFRVADNGPPLVIEHFMKQLGAKIPNAFLRQDGLREIIIRASSGIPHLAIHGAGRVFIEDVCAEHIQMEPGTTLFARQLNIEGHAMKLVNRGGTAWVLGLKTEPAGPILHTSAKGRSEILGAFFYTCIPGGQGLGTIITEDAHATLAGAGEYAWNRAWGTEELMRETRGGETRSLQVGAVPRRGGGSQMPLLVTGAVQPRGVAPGQPAASLVASTAGSVTLQGTATDADGDLVGLAFSRDGVLPVDRLPANINGPKVRPEQVCREGSLRALVKPGQTFTDERLLPDTSYTYTVVAYDRWNQRSTPGSLTVRTPADTVPPAQPDVRTVSTGIRRVTLAWKALVDEIGVTAWELARVEDGQRTVVATGTGADAGTYSDGKVRKEATYRYEMTALDAAGNRSPPSAVEVKIPAQAPRQVVVRLSGPDRHIENALRCFEPRRG